MKTVVHVKTRLGTINAAAYPDSLAKTANLVSLTLYFCCAIMSAMITKTSIMEALNRYLLFGGLLCRQTIGHADVGL